MKPATKTTHFDNSWVDQPTHHEWFSHFKNEQREEMYSDDMFALGTVSMLIATLVSMGVLGMILTVLIC